MEYHSEERGPDSRNTCGLEMIVWGTGRGGGQSEDIWWWGGGERPGRGLVSAGLCPGCRCRAWAGRHPRLPLPCWLPQAGCARGAAAVGCERALGHTVTLCLCWVLLGLVFFIFINFPDQKLGFSWKGMIHKYLLRIVENLQLAQKM